MTWTLRIYMLALLTFLVIGLFGEQKELFASFIAILSLGIAWIEIRFLGDMLNINKQHAANITKILDDLCDELMRAKK